MLRSPSDIYFRADDSQRFLPWLIGIMALLATLLLSLCITLSGWIIATGSQYSQSFTVNIPAFENDGSAQIDKVIQRLQREPGVASVSRLDDAALLKILEPWLGSGESARHLPLPVVLDVSLPSATASVNYKALQQELQDIAPGTEIDAHERWIAAFSGFSAMAQSVLLMLAFTLLAAMALAIAFTSRASLKLHGRTVQLLHSIGAEDRYVARQFQREALRLVMIGAGGGTALAGLLYFALGQYMASLSSGLIPAVGFESAHVQLLIAMPLGCALLAGLVARWSVQRRLSQSL